VLIEALPPVLVLHLKRFLYDAATGSVVKIGKPVQFTPELEIPLGADFLLLATVKGREFIAARSVQTSWHPLPDDPRCRRDTRCMECSITTAGPHVEDIIRSMCSTRTHTVTVGRVGYT
jgi:hypothetical protein